MNAFSISNGGGVERGWVISLLSGAIDWPGYARHLLARMAGRFNADTGGLFLRDPAGDGLTLEAAHNLPPGGVKNARIQNNEGIVSLARANPGGLLVADLREHPGPLLPEIFKNTPARAVMAVWLGGHEAPAGMVVLCREEAGGFTREDLAEAGLAVLRLEVMLDFGAVVSSFARHPSERRDVDESAETGARLFHGKTVAPGRCAGLLSIPR
ncbi:MAG: hypothetical protein FWF96_06790, partial [Kiritimatiellaeota bacterium]|nr:hypothetical protein [Kiritimatiellota bacterium]